MKLRESVKPISYLKAHASELVRNVSDKRGAYIITQNGEAKAVLQDLKSYEQTQESMALLKILAQSAKSKKEGKHKPVKKAFADLSKRIEEVE